MIVLDEQLLGRNLEQEIARWYRGTVQYIVDLRPHTVIKDDAISELLRQQPHPTFVTINERDFWQKITAAPRYCIVCFPLPDSRIQGIPDALRVLLRRPEFRTKAQRMSKIIRVTSNDVRYYTSTERHIQKISLAPRREL